MKTYFVDILSFAFLFGTSSAFVTRSTSSLFLPSLQQQQIFTYEGSAAQINQFSESQYRSTRGTSMEMNLFGRFKRVVKANINTALNKAEDPEKVLEQAVLDMQQDLTKIRQSYAEVSASQKRMERQKDQAEGLANEWYQRAQAALKAGNEGLAKEALNQREKQQAMVNTLSVQLQTQGESVSKLYESMQALEAKITEARSMKDQMVARARTAKTSNKVNQMLSSVGDGSSGMDAFERMRDKVEALEVEAETTAALAGTQSASLEQQFRELEANSSIDNELEKMKKQLGGSSVDAKTLPGSAAVDSELEKMKKEMGSQ